METLVASRRDRARQPLRHRPDLLRLDIPHLLHGTLSVLVDELKIVEQPAPAAAQLHPGMLDDAVAAVLAREPSPPALYAVASTTPRQRLTVTAYGPGLERGFLAGPQRSIVPEQTPFADFVTDLHMTLTAPEPWGSVIVGITGAALLALIISGVLAHPRIFRDAFRLRLNGSRRLHEAELHNRSASGVCRSTSPLLCRARCLV